MWRSELSRIRLRSAARLGLLILAAQIGARALGLEQLRELLERQPEQITEAKDLPDAVDVGLRVAAVLALRARVPAAEQADLLVVADRPRRRAGELGELADPQRPLGGRAHAPAPCGSTTVAVPTSFGRAAETAAPTSETAVRHHSAVCMLEMNGVSCAVEM